MWPFNYLAGNTSAFLNSPCIDLDISLCIKDYIHHSGSPVPGTGNERATNNFHLALNITSRGALQERPVWLYYSAQKEQGKIGAICPSSPSKPVSNLRLKPRVLSNR